MKIRYWITGHPQAVKYMLLGFLLLLLLECFVLLVRLTQKRNVTVIAVFSALTVVISGIGATFCMGILRSDIVLSSPTQPTTVPVTTLPATEPPTYPPETTEPTEPPTTLPPDPIELFSPCKTSLSDPANWNIRWEIFADGSAVTQYSRPNPIYFGQAEDYFALPGISTFRGNNFRNSATYGTASVREKKLHTLWSNPLGSLNDWSGSGWTGQPLIVQWDEQTKQIMNLYSSKKNKQGLVEIIYATLDGNVYFYDLEDGSYTRDPIYLGMNFKGAGTLDPRGYPILYVGSGIYTETQAPRMFVVSLIDGSVLYQYGHNDSDQLRYWSAFDSSPLVNAESDTLIWPGENGILYTIHLNTRYDRQLGTLSMSPDTPVKTRYRSSYSDAGRYLGYETSASIIGSYLYAADNSGLLYCVDLNTMQLIWAQDTGDDNNSSLAFEWGEDDRGYIYSAPSLHFTAVNGRGTISIHKIDAQTGQIVWQRPFDCTTIKDLSGGVQSTPLLGKAGSVIEDLVIYSIARVPSDYRGVLVALDRQTGKTVWEISTGNYAWSSPVAVYTDEGDAYVFICDASGNAKLVDGATGELLDTVSFGSVVEASPVVFRDRIIIGTRAGKAYCLQIT